MLRRHSHTSVQEGCPSSQLSDASTLASGMAMCPRRGWGTRCLSLFVQWVLQVRNVWRIHVFVRAGIARQALGRVRHILRAGITLGFGATLSSLAIS